MKKTINIFIMLLALISMQAQQRPSVEDLHARKWEFIAEKMKFSPVESENIRPLFMMYETEVWKIMEQNRNVYKKFNREKQSTSQPDYAQLNERFIHSEIQKAQLTKNYYLKLKKHLTAEQIFNYFETERSFRKELIRDWQGKGRRQMGR